MIWPENDTFWYEKQNPSDPWKAKYNGMIVPIKTRLLAAVFEKIFSML